MISTVAEGEERKMLSNHFRFQTSSKGNLIYIYNVEFGIFDSREFRFEALR
jgi:hypothetical protein